MDVLLIVSENPGIIQDKIIAGKKRNTKLKRIGDLISAGMIREVGVSRGRTNKTYYLTDDGERLVQLWLNFENGEGVEPMDYDAPSQEGDKVG